MDADVSAVVEGDQVLDDTDLQDALGHDLPFPTESDLVGGLREGVEALALRRLH